VEIDSNKQDREHVPTFSIEATIFDNSGPSDGLNSDMSAANVVNLKSKPNPKGGPCHGFHGYVLGGKMENPKLWSSEKVRDLILGKFHKMLLLQLNCYIL
jgi:beta-galactosidase